MDDHVTSIKKVVKLFICVHEIVFFLNILNLFFKEIETLNTSIQIINSSAINNQTFLINNGDNVIKKIDVSSKQMHSKSLLNFFNFVF